MLTRLHGAARIQLGLGLLLGIAFGILLQKGGATSYDVLVGQLLLRDFTVLKIMLSAVLTGMIVVHLLRSAGLVRLHPKPGSLGSSALGGLLFGAGFGVLGYCPGTLAGACGHGALDALLGGLPGLLIGAWLLAMLYPRLRPRVLAWGDVGERTLPQVLRVNPWAVVIPAALLIAGLLLGLERAGL